jgi:hypothetical protein
VIEGGSELATELWEGPHPAASSILLYPEGRAVLATARRAGRLAGHMYDRAVEDFDALHDELNGVGVDGPPARQAGRLAEDLGLRGYDAVHLASAVALGEDITVITGTPRSRAPRWRPASGWRPRPTQAQGDLPRGLTPAQRRPMR